MESNQISTSAEEHAEKIEAATSGIDFKAWIDGAYRDAQSGETFRTLDPVVDEEIAAIPRCGPADVDAAVAAASDAFSEEWSGTTVDERTDTILEWCDVLSSHVDELALLECLDTGKPLQYAELEVEGAIDFLRYYAKVARGHEAAQIPVDDDTLLYTRDEPYGVCGQITPWNYPMYLAGWKLGPALATGNTVVLKPAEQTPLTSIYLAQLSKDILPDGVLNVVPGFGEEAGSSLTSHSDVDKVAFTGEDVTGEAVMRAAAGNITPVTLELGGKNPFVVFPDADLAAAAETAAGGVFYNTGQSCDACSRLIVHESVVDEFTELFVDEAESFVLGDPLEEDTTLGPLVSADQYEKVTRYIELGQSEGATLVAGGGRPETLEYTDSWFVEPTVFEDVENEMRIAQEEIFGPVETILTFSTYEEAIEIANDTQYGLSAGVATENASRAHRAAGDIEAGVVCVNTYPGDVPGAPFGGYKRSGFGRECAKATLDHYTQTKTVNMALGSAEL